MFLLSKINAFAKRGNHQLFSAPGQLVDSLIPTLSEEAAVRVRKRLRLGQLTFNKSCSDSTWNRHICGDINLVHLVSCVVSPHLDGLVSENKLGYALNLISAYFFVYGSQKMAGAITFCIYSSCSLAMVEHAHAYRDKVRSVDLLVREDENGEEGGGSTEIREKLKEVVAEFSRLLVLSQAFTRAWEWYASLPPLPASVCLSACLPADSLSLRPRYFLVAEFTLLPAAASGTFVCYLRFSGQCEPLGFTTGWLTCMMTVFTTAIVGIIFLVFSWSCQVTGAMKEVTAALHKLRNDAMVSDAIDKKEARKLNVFFEYVKDTPIGFMPYGITVDGRLAVTVFYVLSTLAFTAAIEATFG
jgi:hypothetical protein